MGRKKLQPVELVEDAPLTDGLSVSLNAMSEHRLEIMLVLKQQLKEARIPQAVVARAVAVSEATLAQIVNHNEWPRTSPEEVRQRLASYLESEGIDTAKSFDAAQGAATPRTAGTTDKTNLSEEENMGSTGQTINRGP